MGCPWEPAWGECWEILLTATDSEAGTSPSWPCPSLLQIPRSKVLPSLRSRRHGAWEGAEYSVLFWLQLNLITGACGGRAGLGPQLRAWDDE